AARGRDRREGQPVRLVAGERAARRQPAPRLQRAGRQPAGHAHPARLGVAGHDRLPRRTDRVLRLMRWVTYRTAAGGERPGLLQDGRVHGLDGTLLELIESGLSAAGERALSDPVEVVELADVQLAAPIPRPPSVRDFLSFEEHLRNALRALGRE